MTALAPHLSAYLREHLPRDRAVSPHTVKTYANCFVRRNRPTQLVEPDSPPAEPRASGLALRDLRPTHPDDKEPR